MRHFPWKGNIILCSNRNFKSKKKITIKFYHNIHSVYLTESLQWWKSHLHFWSFSPRNQLYVKKKKKIQRLCHTTLKNTTISARNGVPAIPSHLLIMGLKKKKTFPARPLPLVYLTQPPSGEPNEPVIILPSVCITYLYVYFLLALNLDLFCQKRKVTYSRILTRMV